MLTKRQEKDFERCEELSCCDCECSICAANQNELTINELVKESHENAVKHGFWNSYNYLSDGDIEMAQALRSQFLMLIVGEVSEAMEGLRKGDMNNFKEELADIVIRTTDLAGGLGIDLESEIIKKMKQNKSRPYKHGKKF